MAIIEYTAKRSLAGGHVVNELYAIDLDIQSAAPAVRDVKEIARSPGGAMETTFERQDTFWTILLAPVNGYDLELMREMLDSTESGELFKIWLWPEDAAPLALKRLEDGHQEGAFMRRGSEREDYFESQFTALQAGPYNPAGFFSTSTGGGGGGVSDGDTTDIYDPDIGGPDGGLGPPSGGGNSLIAEEWISGDATLVGADSNWGGGAKGSFSSNVVINDWAIDLLRTLNIYGLDFLRLQMCGDGLDTDTSFLLNINGRSFSSIDAEFQTPSGQCPYWEWTLETPLDLVDGEVYEFDIAEVSDDAEPIDLPFELTAQLTGYYEGAGPTTQVGYSSTGSFFGAGTGGADYNGATIDVGATNLSLFAFFYSTSNVGPTSFNVELWLAVNDLAPPLVAFTTLEVYDDEFSLVMTLGRSSAYSTNIENPEVTSWLWKHTGTALLIKDAEYFFVLS